MTTQIEFQYCGSLSKEIRVDIRRGLDTLEGAMDTLNLFADGADVCSKLSGLIAQYLEQVCGYSKRGAHQALETVSFEIIETN